MALCERKVNIYFCGKHFKTRAQSRNTNSHKFKKEKRKERKKKEKKNCGCVSEPLCTTHHR
jgi:hypothetical protein